MSLSHRPSPIGGPNSLVRLTYYLLTRLYLNGKGNTLEKRPRQIKKTKRTSIASVRNHIRKFAILPASLIFHYPLPLNVYKFGLWHLSKYKMEDISEREANTPARKKKIQPFLSWSICRHKWKSSVADPQGADPHLLPLYVATAG